MGRYPNIPHDKGLTAMRKALDLRKDKKLSTDSLIELAEAVLKNTIFEHNPSFYKQLRGTAIGKKWSHRMLRISWLILIKDFLVIVTFRF